MVSSTLSTKSKRIFRNAFLTVAAEMLTCPTRACYPFKTSIKTETRTLSVNFPPSYCNESEYIQNARPVNSLTAGGVSGSDPVERRLPRLNAVGLKYTDNHISAQDSSPWTGCYSLYHEQPGISL